MPSFSIGRYEVGFGIFCPAPMCFCLQPEFLIYDEKKDKYMVKWCLK